MMLHTKYQGSRPCGFRQDFQSFHLENLFLACVTQICNRPEPNEGHIRFKSAKFGQIQPVV